MEEGSGPALYFPHHLYLPPVVAQIVVLPQPRRGLVSSSGQQQPHLVAPGAAALLAGSGQVVVALLPGIRRPGLHRGAAVKEQG